MGDINFLIENAEKISFSILFVSLFLWTLKKSDEREKLMREQLDKTFPILDGIISRLDFIEGYITKRRKE